MPVSWQWSRTLELEALQYNSFSYTHTGTHRHTYVCKYNLFCIYLYHFFFHNFLSFTHSEHSSQFLWGSHTILLSLNRFLIRWVTQKISRPEAHEQFTLKKFKAQMMMSWAVSMKFILYLARPVRYVGLREAAQSDDRQKKKICIYKKLTQSQTHMCCYK